MNPFLLAHMFQLGGENPPASYLLQTVNFTSFVTGKARRWAVKASQASMISQWIPNRTIICVHIQIYVYIYICTYIMYLNDWSRMPEHLQIAFVWIFDRHAWTVVAKCCLNRSTSHERSGILTVSIDGQIQEKKTCSREVRFQMHWKFIIRAPLTKRQVRTRFQTQLSKDCPMIHGVIWQNQL